MNRRAILFSCLVLAACARQPSTTAPRPQGDFDVVLETLRSGKIPTADLRTHRTPMEDLPGALAQWLKPESRVIKAMVDC